MIDLGDANSTTSSTTGDDFWNNVSGHANATSSSSFSGLRSRSGRRTLTNLSISQPFVGVNLDGEVANHFYAETAQQDSFFAGSFADHAAGLENPGRITLSGLPPEAVCRVSMFASRSGADGARDRLTRYRIGDRFVDLEATDNRDRLAVLYPIKVGSDGSLTIEVAVSPAGTGRFCYLNTFELEIEPRPQLVRASIASGELIYQFLTKRGWPYLIWSGSSLNDWTPLGESFLGSGGPMSTPVIPTTGNQNFIRVQEGL